jgi:hypothetical protein
LRKGFFFVAAGKQFAEMKRKASELEAGASLTEGVGQTALPQGPAVAVKKEESGGGADDNAAGGERPRLPRKKGPKPKRIRRITLKPLNEDEEDALLDNLNASIQDRPRNDDPILARMRRKLALRQVTSDAPPPCTHWPMCGADAGGGAAEAREGHASVGPRHADEQPAGAEEEAALL